MIVVALGSERKGKSFTHQDGIELRM
jgi:hypothetical protein